MALGMYVVSNKDVERVEKYLDKNPGSRIRIASSEFTKKADALDYLMECLEKRFVPWVHIESGQYA